MNMARINLSSTVWEGVRGRATAMRGSGTGSGLGRSMWIQVGRKCLSGPQKNLFNSLAARTHNYISQGMEVNAQCHLASFGGKNTLSQVVTSVITESELLLPISTDNI